MCQPGQGMASFLWLPGQSPFLARAWVPRRPESSAEWAAALQAPQSFHRPGPGLALEEVRGFAPGRELQQVVRDGGWVLAEGGACRRARSRCARGGLRPTSWGLEVGRACWRRGVAGPQCPVCVLAGRPAHKALKSWGHGWAQAFGGEAGVEGVGERGTMRPSRALPAAGLPMAPRRYMGDVWSLQAEDTRRPGTQLCSQT